ncbi:translation factor [Gonapodya prolifera JEL478]|uniref:Threonylcarbamoyl-AMP synthase n=1 Tax=Gonapodya prolifera (strain JEL478) TaxID=1344416 RepID=A0A139A855_GONPJ|nr:translation factor [Gonapodya prolifera JEL478]|eukprot:KXS12879.1 translation factor [Gonapodya prolifera JEL478]
MPSLGDENGSSFYSTKNADSSGGGPIEAPSYKDQQVVTGVSPLDTRLLTVDPLSFPYDDDPRDGDPVEQIQHSQGSRVFNLHANPPTATYAKDVEAVFEAASLLRKNLPVAIPTETVYGLAANALSAEAAMTIFAAKNRPADNPLIVHVSSLDMLRRVLPERHAGDGPEGLQWPEVVQNVSNDTRNDSQLNSSSDAKAFVTNEIQERPDSSHSNGSSLAASNNDQQRLDPLPPHYLTLFRKFWPGPLTVLLPRHPTLIPSATASSLSTVAFRFPSHPVARAVIDACDFPLAAPSANSSGRPSPTTAQHVMADLGGKIPAVLDGGPCETGVESTVVDGWCTWPGVVLRAGGVAWEDVKSVDGWERTKWFKHGKREERNDNSNAKSSSSPLNRRTEVAKDSPKAVNRTPETQDSASLLDPTYTLSMLERPLTPGMKYRHYKPDAEVVAVRFADSSSSTLDNFDRFLTGIARNIQARHDPTHPATYACLVSTSHPGGAMSLSDLTLPPLPQSATLLLYSLGPDLASQARHLFAGLRWADDVGARVCYVEEVEEKGLGRAFRERLGKAAGVHVDI